MDKVNLVGKMEENITVNGLKENNMELVCIEITKEKNGKENGMTGRELSGSIEYSYQLYTI